MPPTARRPPQSASDGQAVRCRARSRLRASAARVAIVAACGGPSSRHQPGGQAYGLGSATCLFVTRRTSLTASVVAAGADSRSRGCEVVDDLTQEVRAGGLPALPRRIAVKNPGAFARGDEDLNLLRRRFLRGHGRLHTQATSGPPRLFPAPRRRTRRRPRARGRPSPEHRTACRRWSRWRRRRDGDG